MIRVYGIQMGNHSFQRVGKGMAEGLVGIGVLSGFLPMDTMDEWSHYPGALSPIGVMSAPPPAMIRLQTLGGAHKHKLFMLAPNSSFIPDEIIALGENCLTGWLAPSSWAASVIRKHTDVPVNVWRHGVDKAFQPDDEAAQERIAEYQQEEFSVIHMSSSSTERKGTAELLDAWCELVARGRLGKRPTLRLMLPRQEIDRYQALVEYDACHDAEVIKTVSLSAPRDMSPDVAAAHYRSAHVVCQPSRGEGWGLVPLEARACGVPVVATTLATGHSEHMNPTTPGVVDVPVGADVAIDDGPGALAPSLDPRALQQSLNRAYDEWPALQAAAFGAARSVGFQWSWRSVTDTWWQAYGQEMSR